ncbi:ATP-grasp domain-containing protein [Paraliomyxa miuraensis]|uniref:ATP-grasp domain-containing protein n=1 Tax=Paraliomyxa miuraensis TaxID=376150 RepID=UPI002256DB4D|nr:ATP-grasp domain-containing protein [Paraliomyxa miuraensis]MCX4241945.1 ATP-grasp domain-containing protein [Paraliomyxa miuraensis]
MHWLLEPDVFGEGPPPLLEPARRAGHEVTIWRDDWWSSQGFPRIEDDRVVFHGSLGNAARIATQLATRQRWSPGAYCNEQRIRCSAWYPAAQRWSLNQRYIATTVGALCADPRAVVKGLGEGLDAIFVRPDSPLKPFSGRVVHLEGLTPGNLDHGFYYDDLALPIVVAPVNAIHEEWRFVAVGGVVITGSGYLAQGRRSTGSVPPAPAWALAETIARELPAPDPVYVLDLGHIEDGLRLVEINPFSGSDLHACDLDAIVTAVAASAVQ